MNALPPFYVILCCFLCLFSFPSQVTYLFNGQYGWCSVMISRVNGPKWENLLQFYFSWLPARREWYYFRLCFSFSCFLFNLTLIKKGHTLNCYSFLHKFLLKTKNTNSLLVTVIAQFTAKTTNSEKTTLRFVHHVLLNKWTKVSLAIQLWKFYIFWFYVLLQQIIGGGATAPCPSPPLLSLWPGIVLNDHPHHFTKYEVKGTKISMFQLFSELRMKIWKCNLGFTKILISHLFYELGKACKHGMNPLSW